MKLPLSEVTRKLREDPAFQLELSFDDPCGIGRIKIPVRAWTDPESIDYAAVRIQNHAMLFGSAAASAAVPEGASQDDVRRFVECVWTRLVARFNLRRYGGSWQSGWSTDYLNSYLGHPFRLQAGGSLAASETFASPGGNGEDIKANVRIGIDVGGTKIKAVLVDPSGEEHHDEMRSREPDGETIRLVENVTTLIGRMLATAQLTAREIDVIGIAWAGAVSSAQNRVGAPSNVFLSSKDSVSSRDDLVWLPDRIAERLDHPVPVYLVNDGNVECHAAAASRRNVLMCKLGHTCAGGMVDSSGFVDFLAEFGRLVIDMADDARKHEWTGIRGLVREYIGSVGLVHAMQDLGVNDIDGTELEKSDIGRTIGNALTTPNYPLRDKCEEAISAMARCLAELISMVASEAGSHGSEIDHILLRGGILDTDPGGRINPVGQRLYEETAKFLGQELAARIAAETGSAHSGAIASSDYAIERWNQEGKPSSHVATGSIHEKKLSIAVRQQIEIVLPADHRREMDLSVPEWSLCASAPAEGFVRHNVAKAENRMPPGCKVGYDVHAQPYLDAGVQHLLLFGTRNAMQNLFLPCWYRSRNPRLLAREDEPWNTETYFALLSRGSVPAMEKVRFVGSDASNADVEIFVDGQWRLDGEVDWLITGQPLTWDSLTIEELEDQWWGATYDLRHLVRLHWESHQGCAADAEIHKEMIGLLMDNLDRPIRERAQRLRAVAGRECLLHESGFYHSSIGLDASGAIRLRGQAGSFYHLHVAHRDQSPRSLLLDNGGSCGYAFQSSRLGRMTVIGNNTYFRPQGHALLTVTLDDDYSEDPFVPREK